MEKKKGGFFATVAIILFIIYIGILFKEIIFKRMGPLEMLSLVDEGIEYITKPEINFIPFYYGSGRWFNRVDILGNILVFIPLGVFTGAIFNKGRFFKTTFLALLLSFSFEGTQYLFNIGSPDITDIITNTTGAVIGLIGCSMVRLIFRERFTRAIVVICSIVVFYLYLNSKNIFPETFRAIFNMVYQ